MENWLIAIIPTLATGIVLAYINKQQKKRDEIAEKKEEKRLESERIRITLLVTAAKLSYATAVAMQRGHTNGEVEDAIRQYQEAMKEFKKFERELVAKQIITE